MKVIFKDQYHQDEYINYVARAFARWKAEERALLYTLSLDKTVRENIDEVYDFKNKEIKERCFEKSWQNDKTKNLIGFAFNVYNGFKGYISSKGEIIDIDVSADNLLNSENSRYILKSMQLRYSSFFFQL